MEKELNLIELLKDAPKGQTLYSPVCGECELAEISRDLISVVALINGEEYNETFCSNGTCYSNCGECVLFPSKENRDWSTFKVKKEGFKVGDHVKHKKTGEVCVLTGKSQDREGFWAKRIICPFDDCNVYISEHELGSFEKVSKFDPKRLNPFDRVLAFDNIHWVWIATLFSHITEEDEDTYPYIMCDASSYVKCIPYNEETKHLVGTADDEPTFYKID